MKTLLVVRHAKSSWGDFSLPDIERPLNDRGKKDAPKMAAKTLQKGVRPDGLASSPAKRALKTAKLFSEGWGIDKKEIQVFDALYEAPIEAFYAVVAQLSNEQNTVALFSHNPGITSFVNTLTNVQIDDMPTCAIYAVSSDATSWKDFRSSEKRFLFFDYPKKEASE